MTASNLFWILTLQFLFGLNYLVSKTIVLHYTPFTWAFARSFFTAFVLLMVIFFRKETRFREVLARKKDFMLLALTGIILNQACFLLGLKFTTSYNSALINTLIPICTLAVAAIKGFESIKSKQIIGAAIALCGVFVLTPPSQFNFSNKHLVGDLLTVGNVLAYSTYLVLNREFVKNHSPLWTTAWVFLFGSVGLFLCAFQDLPPHFFTVPPAPVQRALAYGLVGGTLVPYIILSYALKHTKSSNVALFVYLQPAIVGGLGALFYDHHFTKESLFATFLIFTGVFVATQYPRKAPNAECRQPQETMT